MFALLHVGFYALFLQVIPLEALNSIPAFHSSIPGMSSSSFVLEPNSELRAVSISNNDNPIIRRHEIKDGHTSPEARKTHRKKSIRPSYMRLLDSAQEYQSIVEEEKNKFVVVRFFAHWCKTCKMMSPFFYQMAEKQNQSALFVEIAHTPENAQLFERLGVPGVPYGHIYHPEYGLVHKMPMLKKRDVIEFEKTFNTQYRRWSSMTQQR